jgi:hypothetical protein
MSRDVKSVSTQARYFRSQGIIEELACLRQYPIGKKFGLERDLCQRPGAAGGVVARLHGGPVA